MFAFPYFGKKTAKGDYGKDMSIFLTANLVNRRKEDWKRCKSRKRRIGPFDQLNQKIN